MAPIRIRVFWVLGGIVGSGGVRVKWGWGEVEPCLIWPDSEVSVG